MAAESPSGSDVEILGHCLKDGMVAFHQYNCGCGGQKKHRTHVADKCGTKPTEPWPQELVLTLRSFVEKFPTKLQTEMLGENETPAVAELVPTLSPSVRRRFWAPCLPTLVLKGIFIMPRESAIISGASGRFTHGTLHTATPVVSNGIEAPPAFLISL